MSVGHAVSKPRQPWCLLTVLLALATVLRTYGIDRQGLWSDEIFAVLASYQHGFATIWPLMLNDSHPPGYVSFMYWTLPLTGYTDFGVRLHALLAGIAWIPLAFWLGQRWFSTRTGLMAAALVAASHQAIYYSQEARAYTLLVACGLLNTGFLLEILLRGSRRARDRLGFMLSLLAMLYLHYTGFVILCAEIALCAIFCVTGWRQCRWRECVVLLGVPLLLFVPWLGVMYGHMTNTSLNWAVSEAPALADVYRVAQRLFGPDVSHTNFYIAGLAIAVPALLLPGFFPGQHQRRAAFCLLWLLVLPPLAFFIQSHVGSPIFEKRYFLHCLPLAAILCAVVLDTVLAPVEKILAAGLPASLLSLLLLVWGVQASVDKGIYSELNKDPVRESVQWLKHNQAEKGLAGQCTVAISHDWFEHYLRFIGVAFDLQWKNKVYYQPEKLMQVEKYLALHADTTCLYYMALRVPHVDAAVSALKQRYRLEEKKSFEVPTGSIDVYRFNTRAEPDVASLSGEAGAANSVARWVQEKMAERATPYAVAYADEWMEPYMARRDIIIDTQWAGRKYFIENQSGNIVQYLANHPEVEYLYYLATANANTQSAVLALQLRYHLLEQYQTASDGKQLGAYLFAVKQAPVNDVSLQQALQASETQKAIDWIRQQSASMAPDSYTVLMSHDWLQPFVQLNRLPHEGMWAGHLYYSETQAEEVIQYVAAQPQWETVYYLALRDGNSDGLAAALLETQYRLDGQTSFTVPSGTLDVFRFATRAAPLHKQGVLPRLTASAVDTLVTIMQKHITNRAPGSYRILAGHEAFAVYLRAHDVAMGEDSYQMFYAPSHVHLLDTALQQYPAVGTLYYLGLDGAGANESLDALRQRFLLECESAAQASFGRVRLLRFNTQVKPATPDAVTDCD